MHRFIIQIAIIYLTGLVLGITLVTFPAAGTLLTSTHAQGLSSGEYGLLFIPMNIGAIGAALFGGNLAARYGLKPIFLCGLTGNIASMLLFASSTLFFGHHALVYGVMLAALLMMGLGFGGTLTVLNTYAAHFFPARVSTALTALHTLLGIGCALAPLFFNIFMERGIWWGEPLTLTSVLVIIAAFSAAFLDREPADVESKMAKKTPRLLWMFILVAFLYGYCETVFGNWSTLYLTQIKHLTASDAGIALSVFWATVTAGRLLITVGSVYVSPGKIYALLPPLIFGAYAVLPYMMGATPNILIFAAAGLACSGMLPLTIGFAQADYPPFAAVASGRLIASYMLGYGIASYGVGAAIDRTMVSLNDVYAYAAPVALFLAACSLMLLRLRKHV